MSKIKMIALDLDGTLFNDDKIISQHNREIIIKAINQDVIVLPATGRHFDGLKDVFNQMPEFQYALTSNGAAVYKLQTKELLVHDFIPNELAIKVVSMLQDLGEAPDVYMNGLCYADERNYLQVLDYDIPQVLKDYIRKSRIVVKNLPEFLKENAGGLEKIQCMFDLRQPERRPKAFEMMRQFDHLDVSSAFEYNMEITSDTINKGQALLNLGSLLGIEKDEIMACGDGFNDFKMLQAVGTAVVMDNAPDEVKAIADFVTKSNNDDGVAYAIEQLVINKKKLPR